MFRRKELQVTLIGCGNNAQCPCGVPCNLAERVNSSQVKGTGFGRIAALVLFLTVLTVSVAMAQFRPYSIPPPPPVPPQIQVYVPAPPPQHLPRYFPDTEVRVYNNNEIYIDNSNQQNVFIYNGGAQQ